MITEMTLDAKRRFVKIIFSGQIDHKEILNARSEIAELIKKNGIKNLLVDMRKVDLKLLTIDIYDFSTSERDFFPPGTKIAALARGEESDFEKFKFMETVHYNSGFCFKIFLKMSDAIGWLGGSSAEGK